MARNMEAMELGDAASVDSASSDDEGGLGVHEAGVIDFDEDTAALTIVQLVFDSQKLASGKANKTVVASRFVVAMGLYLLTLFVQIYLLKQVKHFVCAQAVHDVREVYDKYEEIMYSVGGNKTLTDPDCYHYTVNGKHRGVPKCFNPSNFQYVPSDIQASACRITLSQPHFIGAVLFLWSVTCLAELRKTWKTFRCLIVRTETAETMEHVFVDGFADLILNAVALEFVLLIKEMLYVAMVPRRVASDLENLKMIPEQEKFNANIIQMFEVLVWFGLTVGWVLYYMYHFQMVLPEYNWDVRTVCASWIEKRYAV